MTTLFSPIGTADPMTRLGDGPMLHLVRHRKPDRVVLFLSPKMQEIQSRDKRFTRAIEDCAKITGGSMPDVQIIESCSNEVFRFDHYIEEFEFALDDIERMHPGEEVIVNVSSGTPGMQEALVAIGAFGRQNTTLLQVTTPRMDANKREDRERQDDYDYESLWAANPDNEKGAPQRLVEVSTPNFRERLLKKNIIELVGRYDYAAARQLAASASSVSSEAQELIEAAADRLNLDQALPAQVFSTKRMGTKNLCYRANRPLLEYVQTLEVRLRQARYADFVRAVTPAITETTLSVLEPYLPRKSYLSEGGLKKRLYRFDATKVQEVPGLESLLASKCGVNTKGDRYKMNLEFITNRMLIEIARQFCPQKTPDDAEVMEKLELLDAFERNIRNVAAHQIRKMDKDFIEETGGTRLDEVFLALCKLNDIEPGLYDRINERILALL